MKNLKEKLVVLADVLNTVMASDIGIEITKRSILISYNGRGYAIRFSRKTNKNFVLFNLLDIENNELYKNLCFDELDLAISELDDNESYGYI